MLLLALGPFMHPTIGRYAAEAKWSSGRKLKYFLSLQKCAEK